MYLRNFVLAVLLTLLSINCGKKEQDVIKIGVITPLSGESAKYGQDIKRGYDLAIEEINALGGIKGNKLELIYEDDQGVPEKAVSAATKLIAKDNVIAILGALWSSPTLAVAPIAEKNKIILLSSGSSSPKVTNAGDYVFRNEISDEYGGEKGAEMYLKLGYKSIAILYINNEYGTGMRDVTIKTYQRLGGKITIAESFEQNTKDFRAQLAKIKQTKPEALFLVGYKEVIWALKQMKELGIRIQVLGSTLFEDPEIPELAGDAANGVIYAYYGTFDTTSSDSLVKRFVEKFTQRYHEAPQYYAPIGYDAVNILITAMRNSTQLEGEQIKQALYKVQNFPGVSGITSFDENGDVVKPVVPKKIENGRFVKY